VDLAESPASIDLIETMYRLGRPVGAVCHGPAAFRHTRGADDQPLLKDKRVTGFTNTEEAATGLIDVLPLPGREACCARTVAALPADPTGFRTPKRMGICSLDKTRHHPSQPPKPCFTRSRCYPSWPHTRTASRFRRHALELCHDPPRKGYPQNRDRRLRAVITASAAMQTGALLSLLRPDTNSVTDY
jgi:hypothetical protein